MLHAFGDARHSNRCSQAPETASLTRKRTKDYNRLVSSLQQSFSAECIASDETAQLSGIGAIFEGMTGNPEAVVTEAHRKRLTRVVLLVENEESNVMNFARGA